MKRVCIVSHSYLPEDPRVCKEAVALVEKGYDVDIICLQGNGQARNETYRGVHIYRIPVQHRRGAISRYLFEYLAFFSLAALKLTLLFFRKRFDFIETTTLPDFLVFVTLIPKLFGARVILDLHEPSPELTGAILGFNRHLLLKLTKVIEQASVRYADKAITVSDEMKSNFVKRGAAASKITVTLNVPGWEFNPDLCTRAGRDGKNHRFSIVCHGSIIKRYGQGTVIRAIPLLKDEIPSIQFNVLGRGEYEDELKRLAKDLGVEKFVLFHGFRPFDEMINVIANCEIGIVPVERNPYSDLVHTNKMFDFIAMRKPIILTRTRAVENFMGPDDLCVKYFESGDEKDLARCILELHRHPEIRDEMARNAFRKYESVRWNITKEIYCNLFL